MDSQLEQISNMMERYVVKMGLVGGCGLAICLDKVPRDIHGSE